MTLVASAAYVVRSSGREKALGATGSAAHPAGGLGAAAGYVFRSTTRGASYGRVAYAPITDLTHPAMTNLRCDRVDFAGGRGMCLALDPHSFQVRSGRSSGGSYNPYMTEGCRPLGHAGLGSSAFAHHY